MPYFTYKARDTKGRIIHGSMEAQSSYDIAQRLAKEFYIVISVGEVKLKNEFIKELVSGFKRLFVTVKPQDILNFYLHISVMISAGVPILNCLEISYNQTHNPQFKGILQDVAAKIRGGKSFSEALAGHSIVFPKLLINAVYAGEASGELDKVLKKLAEFSELMLKLRNDVKGALIYPFFLLVVGLGITLFLLVFVIPRFTEVFTRAGVKLPLPTQILVTLSDFVTKHGQSYFFVLLGMFIAIVVCLQFPFGRRQADLLKMNFPVLGPSVKGLCLSRFSHTLATLLSAGVPILEALEIAQENIGNVVLSKEIEVVSNRVREGKELSASMVGTHFSYDIIQMIKVGEATGKMGFVLEKVAQLYDMNVAYQIKKITVLIEPVVLLFGGGIVGFIMASILLPMFDMIKTLQR